MPSMKELIATKFVGVKVFELLLYIFGLFRIISKRFKLEVQQPGSLRL